MTREARDAPTGIERAVWVPQRPWCPAKLGHGAEALEP
jgi:hypothetical protein